MHLTQMQLSISVTFKILCIFILPYCLSSKYNIFIKVILLHFNNSTLILFLYITSSSSLSTWTFILRKHLPWSRFLPMIQYYVVLLFASRLEWDAPYSAYLLTTLYFLTIFIFSSQNFNKNVFSKFTNDHHIDKYNSFSLGLLGSILSFSLVTCMTQPRCSRKHQIYDWNFI